MKYIVYVVLIDVTPPKIVCEGEDALIPFRAMTPREAGVVYRVAYIAYRNFVTLDKAGLIPSPLSEDLEDLTEELWVVNMVENAVKDAVALAMINGRYVLVAGDPHGKFITVVWPGRNVPGAIIADVMGEEGGEDTDYLTITDADINLIEQGIRPLLLKAANNEFIGKDRVRLVIMLGKSPDGGREIKNVVSTTEDVRAIIQSYSQI